MSIAYRPEIDGLRAVAVLGVLIYHAEIMLGDTRVLSAGFLGVDIFFVISGFLITRILYTDVLAERFSFLNFYERRARRILPMLFLVMLCTAPFAWWLMLPPAMVDYAGSVFTSIVYGSNFWFWSSDSYWGQASALKPLLHTWSLSLEEQFYLIAPVAVLLLATKQRLFISAICVALFGSFLLAELWSRTSPESAFYLLPARAWELLVGSLVAIYSVASSSSYALKNSNAQSSQKIAQDGKRELVQGQRSHDAFLSDFSREWLSFIGILMVVLPIALFDSSLRHPSAYTLIPVVGTAIVLLFSENTRVGFLLALKPMIWLGLLSYSVYLWHFPIFAFFKIASVELSLLEKIGCMAISIILAFVSYHLVEKPFRNPLKVSGRVFIYCLSIIMVLMLFASAWAFKSKGLPNRFDDFDNVLSYLDYPYKASFLSHQCFLHPEDLKAKTGFINCAFNKLDETSLPTLYLWGDSNAAHLIPGIKRRFQSSHNLVIRTISGCGVFMTEVKPTRPGCKDYNAESIKQIIAHKPDLLIIAGLWKPKFVDRLALTLEKLKNEGIVNVMVVGPVPQWTPSLPAAIIKYQGSVESARRFPRYLPDRSFESINQVDERMREMVARYGYQYHSPIRHLCNADGCLTNINGALTQWDYGHLTNEGSYEIVDKLVIEK